MTEKVELDIIVLLPDVPDAMQRRPQVIILFNGAKGGSSAQIDASRYALAVDRFGAARSSSG